MLRRRRRFGSSAAAAVALLAPIPAAAQSPGEANHAEALRLLEDGAPAGAVEAAWQALVESREFSPPEWVAAAPEGGLVLDETTGAATAAYRQQRARYRETLGAALAAAGDVAGAEQELRRAAQLRPGPRVFRRLADLPGIPGAERVEWLLAAWGAEEPGAGGGLLDELRATGAFRTGAGLAAALDRVRLRSGRGVRRGLPEEVTLHPGVFPSASVAVEGGVWSSERSFGEGRWLLLYFPRGGCEQCGAVVSELGSALRGQSIDLLAAAADPDLPVLMQIAGLTGAGLFRPEPDTAGGRSGLEGRPIGHSVRRAVVPFPAGRTEEPAGEGETMFLVARAGLSVWRIDLEAAGSARRPLQSLFRFLRASPVPGDGTELVELTEDPAELLAALGGLEAGIEPLQDLDARLLGSVRRALREAGDSEAAARRLLPLAAGLETGDGARVRLLTAIVPRFGETALAAAREVDPAVARAVPGGRARVAVADGGFGFQREYEREDGVGVVLASRLAPELEVVSVSEGRAEGVFSGMDGLLFRRRSPEDLECVGWIEPGGGFTEACPAIIVDGLPVVRASQLLPAAGEEPAAEGVWMWKRVDGRAGSAAGEALFDGIEAFAGGDFGAAREAFERAASQVVPGSPVDLSAVRYNLGRVAEAEGRREDALAALLAIGDAPFPARLAAAVRRLYRQGQPDGSPEARRGGLRGGEP